MKKIILCLFLLQSFLLANAQQNAQYTQFMFNKLALNPAYAGSSEVPCISCLHRSQWVGLDGAPTSQSVNFHMPFFKNRVGFGVSINHDQIGPTNSWNLGMMYAYHLPVSDHSKLSIGVQGSLRSYSVNWSETTSTQDGDGAIPMVDNATVLPNFGMGLYYYSKKFYVGVSATSLINGDLSLFEDAANSDLDGEEMHAFVMSGIVLPLTSKIKIKPAILVKYTANTPFDMDIHTSLIFFNKLWTGLTYRLGGLKDNDIGESIDFTLQYQISNKIRAGLAYDFTLSDVRNYNDGTYEVMLEYCLNHNDKRLTNPRFF